MHDVVGHSLAVITMQAGVALHLLDKERTGNPRPDQVASSLQAIKQTSREALAELRTTLGIFRADSEEPRSPLPGLARLDDLVDGLRSAGRDDPDPGTQMMILKSCQRPSTKRHSGSSRSR